MLGNILRVLQVLFFVTLLGLPLYFSWDALALMFAWPRPTWMAAGGVIYIAGAANFWWNTHFTIGRQVANTNESNNDT